ncbi:MAG TPA: serine/threonine-protein kinase [Pirellulales bacterium]|nr:serine/threonine-protein kinase [Pirellulales bacterium]
MDSTPGEAFHGLLKKSRLLETEQLAQVAARVAAEKGLTPPRLAKDLVGRGWITEWQARQLLSGRYGFFMGKYKLLERLGGGGMGVVFKAHHSMTDRTVALKVMARSLVKDPAAAARFQREVRLVCALNHPNIIAAYDADCAAGTYFLVMEYGQGRDLRVWLREYGTLPVAWSCECARQAALALAHAHERGLVHRDIKPENLLVDGDPNSGRPVVKILDMGLARLMDVETSEDAQLASGGHLLGTPDYVAPEQAEDNRKADIRSDIFSLGCTLFRLLTGTSAFPGDDAAQKLMARLTRDAPPPSSLRADLPPELDRVVAQMVARAPDDRFQTPAEVAEALLPFTSEGQTAVAPPPPHNPPEEAKYEEAVSAVDIAVDTFLTQLANQTEAESAPRVAPPAEVSLPPAALPPAALPARRSPSTAALPKATLITPPVVSAAPDFASLRPSSQPPAVSALSRRSSSAPRSRRGDFGRKNLAVGVAVGVLVSLPVIALLLWLTRPGTLALDWRLDDRKGCGLDVDGKKVAIPKNNPATISLTPGKHRVVARRRGYDQLEWKFFIARGERIERTVKWKKFDFDTRRP